MKKICERLSDLSSRMCGTWRCGMRDRTGIRAGTRELQQAFRESGLKRPDLGNRFG